MKKIVTLLMCLVLLCGCELLPIEVVDAEEFDLHDPSNRYYLDYCEGMLR